MSHEPGLRFWLRYAEREGALVEDAGDQAVAVLPEPLQSAERLPEEITVTSDPDVAREDGALLLIAGHPALERAAGAILAEGDAGRGFMPWPAAKPPTAGQLQDRARERFHVEHGRIDAAGHARAAYVPLLRVGAMVSHRASLTQRVQEQEEAWVDARTGLVLPASVLEAVAGWSWLPAPDTRHKVLEAALAETLPAAHAELERRAEERSRVLRGQTQRPLAAELSRADAYYTDALGAIERRRDAAPADRRRLLDAQHERTRAEHSRRRREIEEEYRAGHGIRPFRLHLLHAPALVLDVEIRRGSRAYPFVLTWLIAAGAFCAVRCPHCGAADALVAGRERLGCVACLARPAVKRPAPVASEPAAPAPRAAKPAPPRARQPAPPPPRGAPRRDRRPGQSLERVGSKLAFAFWRSVADGQRWPRKKLAPHSPLSALHRLYGAVGPLYVLGLGPDAWPSEFTAGTHPSQPGLPVLTTGALIVGSVRVPYGLTWWLEAGKPVLAEVTPGPSFGRVQVPDPPAPRLELDPVAAGLWNVELAVSGLPLVVRGLATWWRIEGSISERHEPGAIAGAVAAAVSRASALGRRRGEIAGLHGVGLTAIERVEREAGKLLKLDRDRGW
jgi:hypothetical protein